MKSGNAKLSGNGNESGQKKTYTGRLKLEKENNSNNFARAAHFCVHFFAVVLQNYNVKRAETS